MQCVVLQIMRGKKGILRKALMFLHKMQNSLIIVYFGCYMKRELSKLQNKLMHY